MSLITAVPNRTSNDAALNLLEELLGPGIAAWHSSQHVVERRDAHRLPLSQEVCVIGLDDQFRPSTEPLLMEGRDVSGQGMSFSHREPITTRFAAVSFRIATGIETAVVKLSWCRFSRPGQYISGGKFVKHRPQIVIPTDWSVLAKG